MSWGVVSRGSTTRGTHPEAEARRLAAEDGAHRAPIPAIAEEQVGDDRVRHDDEEAPRDGVHEPRAADGPHAGPEDHAQLGGRDEAVEERGGALPAEAIEDAPDERGQEELGGRGRGSERGQDPDGPRLGGSGGRPRPGREVPRERGQGDEGHHGRGHDDEEGRQVEGAQGARFEAIAARRGRFVVAVAATAAAKQQGQVAPRRRCVATPPPDGGRRCQGRRGVAGQHPRIARPVESRGPDALRGEQDRKGRRTEDGSCRTTHDHVCIPCLQLNGRQMVHPKRPKDLRSVSRDGTQRLLTQNADHDAGRRFSL